ncbi:MAG: glycine--tRNA ligase subunit beta [Chloroflexi bacterium]|nr:glycine--tRNA ligase subunit beta [Chloroflexota bacterium]
MTEALDFQSIILTLHKFWADQGCLIWHPYYSQMGAGTMNPATFLRVLGPEPWNVGYVEPSIRPADGRYGENPNRLQQFYQYQVILKPDPGNPQELYLNSLEAIGIDTHKHDIRFVEDNWESPALGAWGLGWEVWLDGLEITQFTYFQQAGGTTLDPVSVEITYGLDRIAAPLQKARGFQDIRWNSQRSFGDVNLQGEMEQSKYYFEVADVKRMQKIYKLHAEEAEAALEHDLVLPAYDHLLRLSHIFNIFDSRGAIGVTERQAYFREMRGLSTKVTERYLEQRQRMEYPWLDKGEEKQKKKKTAQLKGPSAAESFLFEIGTEELPPSDLDSLLGQLQEKVPALLYELRLEYGEVRVFGTPRRLVVHVSELAAKQADWEEVVKGPPAERAFDADGKPTKAALGFAQGKGISAQDLEIREIDGGKYAVAAVKEAGRPTIDVLAEGFNLISDLRVNRSMRWDSSNAAFSRPIRWLLAMYGKHVVPLEYANLESGNTTRGLRFSEPETFAVKDAEDYASQLGAQGIILDVEARREKIWAQVTKLAAEAGGEVVEDEALLAEVTNLVEAPTALLGSFDKAHLELPREVLVSVMKKHQRYFPVEKKGKLLPYFITVRNGGKENLDLIAEGNEAVIRARFADAAFFIGEDLKQPLSEYTLKLDTLSFQKDLGSMEDKTNRIRSLVQNFLIPELNINKEDISTAIEAAVLCKADLVTKMVVEMTSLQGEMGRYYALESGESEEVATAIFEHYLPRFAEDDTPMTKPGLIVGLADRLDSLAGLFAAGLEPSGSKDPFALRRTALGLVQNLIVWDLEVDLHELLSMADSQITIKKSTDGVKASLDFIERRMQGLFREQGYRYDIVESVLSAQSHNPASAARAVKELSEWVAREDWDKILPQYSRCVRITRDISEQYKVNPKKLEKTAEKELFIALEQAEAKPRAPGSIDDFLNAFKPMIPAVDKFFEDVLVMVEDEDVKSNRLGLLQRISALADGVAAMEKLEGF